MGWGLSHRQSFERLGFDQDVPDRLCRGRPPPTAIPGAWLVRLNCLGIRQLERLASYGADQRQAGGLRLPLLFDLNMNRARFLSAFDTPITHPFKKSRLLPNQRYTGRRFPETRQIRLNFHELRALRGLRGLRGLQGLQGLQSQFLWRCVIFGICEDGSNCISIQSSKRFIHFPRFAESLRSKLGSKR